MRAFIARAGLAWALAGFLATGFLTKVAAQPRAPQSVDGNVIEVLSGDLLVVVADGTKYKIRLLGVDAPESGQPYFDDAIRVLSEKVMSRKVHVDLKGGDRATGFLGLVKQGDKAINRAMVAEGAAWHDDVVPSPALKAAQTAAQQQKLGLWAASEPPVSPREFREQQPDAAALAEERHKAREEEAAKAAGEFLAAWQSGAAPDDLLTTKGRAAEEEKKKAPGALSGVEITPGKVQIRGNSADVLLNLSKGDMKLRGKVKLKSEQKQWLVMAVEIGSPPAILDFENTKSTVDKLEAALDKGFTEKEDTGKGGGAPGRSGKGKGKDPAAEEVAAEEPPSEEPAAEPSADASAETEAETPPAAEVPAALGKVRPRGMGANLSGNRDAESGGEGDAPAESAKHPFDSDMDTNLRSFLAGWVRGDTEEIKTVVHSAAGEADLTTLPPAPEGVDGDAIAALKLRRLQIGDSYNDAAGTEQTVGPGDASDAAALIVSQHDALPYRMVRVDDTWKVDFDHLLQRQAAPPPEPPTELRNPKFRNR